METKKFKPFDKVVIREDKNSKWICDFYSHNDNWTKECWCLGIRKWIGIDNILPYEGNEHLVGTTDEPETEVRLEEGEWIYVSDYRHAFPCDWDLRIFDNVSDNRIRVYKNKTHIHLSSNTPEHWCFAVKFSDFNPNDMEETKKHILCVKGGKIVKYKG